MAVTLVKESVTRGSRVILVVMNPRVILGSRIILVIVILMTRSAPLVYSARRCSCVTSCSSSGRIVVGT